MPWATFAALAAFAVALLAGGCRQPPRASGNILAGLAPTRSVGVDHPARLTDGATARQGSHWKTELTTQFRTEASFVEFDLGDSKPIEAALLQGDNNDSYIVSVSEDGKAFATLWTAPAVSGRGLQKRFTDGLGARARFVRVSASGGDRKYGLTEIQLFSETPEVFPPPTVERAGLPPADALRAALLTFTLALAAFVVLAYRGAGPWWLALLLAPCAYAGFEVVRGILWAWPIEPREVSMLRAATAGVAAIAVAREAFAPARYPASRFAVVGALGTCAALSLAAFYNVGRAQFTDHRNGQPTVVHTFDMRVYFPIAKYYDELRFDGVYLASVAAYVDDVPSATLDSVGNVELRDLETHQAVRVSAVRDRVKEVKSRFSPERWESFKKDMRYFRETMGVRDYLGSMLDHGGNATPVWLTIAHVLFANLDASRSTLLMTAALDPLLLLLAFVAVGWAFGPRTGLICAVVFGANDFYMFGSDWAGATLRHDWMAYIAFGLCALKRERWMLGGALLAMAAMIRAFPALAFVGVALAAAWWAWERARERGRAPSWADIKRHQGALGRVAAGAALCVAVGLVASSLVLSPEAWLLWFKKVALLNRDPHVNEVSLRSVIAGSDGLAVQAFRARLPVFLLAAATFSAAVAVACRGKEPCRAAALGLILIPVVFHPANYYAHFVFALPVLAVERGPRERGPEPAVGPWDGFVWISVLGICVAQYWTVLVKDLALHFEVASAILMAGIATLLAAVIGRDRAAWRGTAAAARSKWSVPAASVLERVRASVALRDPGPSVRVGFARAARGPAGGIVRVVAAAGPATDGARSDPRSEE